MTRDDIIRLAQEVWSAGDVYIGPSTESLERFATLVAAAEREACEQVCERRKSLYWMEFDKTGSDAERSAAIASEECATAIRARGESK
jgi:hypothetical protein